MYFYIKALHIIFIVTWFSGLFYIVRLFVYNREAQDKDIPEKKILSDQFSIMIRRSSLFKARTALAKPCAVSVV